MLKNDAKVDLKTLSIRENIQLKDAAESVGIMPQYVSQLYKQKLINDKYVKLIEALGYDIEIHYIKRDSE